MIKASFRKTNGHQLSKLSSHLMQILIGSRAKSVTKSHEMNDHQAANTDLSVVFLMMRESIQLCICLHSASIFYNINIYSIS